MGVVATVVLLGLFIWLVIWLARNYAPQLEAVRDVAIIGLAMASCLFFAVLMLMLIMIIRLVNMLEFEIKPILEQTNETVSTVRGTTVFVSRNVVRPVTMTAGYIAGFRRGLRVLFGEPRKNLPD